jgi:hypothetical protein
MIAGEETSAAFRRGVDRPLCAMVRDALVPSAPHHEALVVVEVISNASW